MRLRHPMPWLAPGLLALIAFAPLAAAQSNEARQAGSLDELLEMVQEKTLLDRSKLKQREAEFAVARERQAELLAEAKARRDELEARSQTLEKAFEEKKAIIDDKQLRFDNKLGALKELFGIFQQTAGDLQGAFHNSPVSAQYPDRGEFLEGFAKKMSRASQISTIDEIERLWFELQREITETGKVVRFSAPVLGADGRESRREVIRVGTFNMITNDPEPRYLAWRAEQQTLAELPRQPAAQLDEVAAFATSDAAVADLAIDPAGGGLLARLLQAPRLSERIEQGGLVGYIIIALGLVTLVVALERLIVLALTMRRVRAQMRQPDSPAAGNPMGRVLRAYHENQGVDAETLEMKLGKAILRETPRLNRMLTFLKIIAVAAPLLGLLGTVTGMINTFQAITLFGTGDPKTMAGGISQALVTTVLGLTVAIPTLFLHSAAAQRARVIVHMLQEQSTGLVAEYMERRPA